MGWVVKATPRPLHAREIPGTYCIGGWMGPRTGLERCGKDRPPPGFDPRTVQPVASRYTDWNTSAPTFCVAGPNFLLCRQVWTQSWFLKAWRHLVVSWPRNKGKFWKSYYLGMFKDLITQSQKLIADPVGHQGDPHWRHHSYWFIALYVSVVNNHITPHWEHSVLVTCRSDILKQGILSATTRNDFHISGEWIYHAEAFYIPEYSYTLFEEVVTTPQIVVTHAIIPVYIYIYIYILCP
jgi:hypothetical protein